ncbi:hypothetical protein J3D47_002651 [Pseudomonas laurylsulfativorans]|uniref:hypothetical protein n=1 Tax=Pseudomonas laurylsulfativorans TaxID=1943631 RepID=UPI00209DB0B7|nr:hypothetical protein [Pseudomonas laurylsulfativorans]MCP1418408.1 hypothetical protein [Pseudomonas laurylsulfativorans]
MKYRFLSGVVIAVAATMLMPQAWADDAQAVAEEDCDHMGAGKVAADGSDHMGAKRLAADGSDHLNASRLPYSSRVGVGSDRVASDLMSGSYSDQFNDPVSF